MLGLQALLFSSWLLVATAFDLTGMVVWNDVCPDAVSLGRGKVVLNNGQLGGSVTANGSFTIYNVPTGSHLLSVVAHDHSFDNLRVDVNNETAHVHPYTLGTPFNPPSTVSLSYPLKLTPKEKLDFFVPPHSFSLSGLLTNPMVLFGIGGLALFAINSLVDVNALQEAAKQGSESNTSPPRLADGHDQIRGGPMKRGTKRTRR
ncbi:hypothetical protein Agabi119p4_631 [Agaricus bisporus var. burnettii]|uniref:ER membrane protein complex subunit 7 beta-sandwich domain-containing protein n=1 Tax=Agaricus bisporus var. burnettii TaxID=192524 RepID=A0A8H7KL55_AGABI|nr:hypothetical protein Agabi119p4_631 [Agaricus bisporus var. burnettii]